MRNNSENENQHSFLSRFKNQDKLLLIIIITIILIIILLFYLIEKIIFIILTKITFTSLISFPLQIFLHLLLIRYIIIQIAFSGQNNLISRSIFYGFGKMQACHVHDTLRPLLTSLLSFQQKIKDLYISLNELNSLKRYLNSVNYLIDIYLDIFNKMKNKFNQLTLDQQIFYNNLNYLKDAINKDNLGNFIDDSIRVIETNGKNSIIELPEEILNNIKSTISEQNSNIFNTDKIMEILLSMIKQVEDYIGENYHCFTRRYIRNYLHNKLFGSLEQFQVELNDKFNIREYQLITKDKCQIEYIIIKSQYEAPRKKLMIMCGPNGVPYQIFVRNINLENYSHSGIDVLCWNYRGYGFSKGKSSYNKLRSDVLELFDEVKNNLHYERFAVHGISIGGIPCCHLARNRSEVELMICDRNFGRLDNITQSFICGKFLFFIYKYFYFQSSDNVDNYLNVKCDKIILNDAKDKIVLETCSLKTLVAQSLCEKYFECHNDNNLVKMELKDIITDNSNQNSISDNANNRNHNNELESLSSKKDNNPYQNITLNTLTTSANGNNNMNKEKVLLKKTVLDKIFDSVEEKNYFVHSLIMISNIINKDKLEVNQKKTFFSGIINLVKKNSFQYSNLKEEELQNTSGIFDFVKDHMLEILDSVQSAGDSLLSLISITRDYTKQIYIDNFFNNMFIWGSLNYNYNHGEMQIHKLKNVKNILKGTMKLFDEFINSQEIMNYRELTIVKEINNIYNYFSKIVKNLENIGLNTKNGFIKLIKEDLIDDENKNLSYEKCLMQLNRGNYVPLYCGHNGALSKEEREMLDYFLMKTSFINTDIENIKVESISTNEDTDLLKMNSPDSSTNIINVA